MEVMKVQTQLASRYRIFDTSGKLPFDVVFGLRRRSSQDEDPRDIRFKITGSILDVPHALVHGLLRLCELRTSESGATDRVEVDLTSLRDAIADDQSSLEYIVLPSKANRVAKPGSESFTVYHYRINPGSPLASLLVPGKKYSIGLVERDLGVHEFDAACEETDPEDIKDSTDTCKLVSNPHGGFAVFEATESLAWPQVTTRLSLVEGSKDQQDGFDEVSPLSLQITVTNTGSRPISVQTRGQQQFLRPWGVLQPEDADISNDKSPRIIDSSVPTSCLQVIRADTGSVVRGRIQPRRGCAGLTSGNVDHRPKVEDLLVLEPKTPLIREIELEILLHKLEDGSYHIQIRSEGCWWHEGVLESEPDDDGKVPRHLVNNKRTPLMLETEDKVAFNIDGGKLRWDV